MPGRPLYRAWNPRTDPASLPESEANAVVTRGQSGCGPAPYGTLLIAVSNAPRITLCPQIRSPAIFLSRLCSFPRQVRSTCYTDSRIDLVPRPLRYISGKQGTVGPCSRCISVTAAVHLQRPSRTQGMSVMDLSILNQAICLYDSQLACEVLQ